MAKGGGIPNTALRMERIHLIHDRLKRGGRVHAKELSELCESCGSKASQRTIMRDIEFLRSAFQAPIPDPPLPDGYYYTDTKFELAGEVMLEEGEILAFMVAQRVVDGLGGSPFAESLRQGLDRISRRLARKLPVKVEDLFQVDAGPLREVSPEVFHAVDLALSRRLPLDLSYRALSSDEVTQRVVEPYVLKNHRGDWYLIGYCRLRRDVRTFALSRMLRCAVVEGPSFKVPADFDVEAYFANALSLFTGKQAEQCTIWFSPLARRWITERRWHPSQEVEESPDGSILLHMKVAPSQEVVRWILGHGEDARALAPPSLVAEVERHVRGMHRRLEEA